MKLNEFLVQVFGSERANSEFEQLSTWKEEGELNAKHLQEMASLNLLSDDLKTYQSFDVEAALNKTLNQLDTPTTAKRSNYWFIALALLFVAFAGFLSYKYFNKSEITYYASAETLENTLEDGTIFHLNEQASLYFDEDKNAMKLVGEAFFDVEKQDKPLSISTSMGDIEVLGTSFNVISKSDYTEVYMYSGTISFTNLIGEEIEISENEGIRVTDQGIELFNSDNKQLYNYWLTHELSYKNTPLTNVLSDLERLYNKDFSSFKSQPSELFVTANFKNNSLEEIIQELQVITGLSF